MKTDKEYPATHSMDTTWYIVDEEGNVGLLDISANGPVPFGLGENNMEDLSIGLHDEGDDCLEIQLTDEQLFEILDEPCPPDEKKFWFDEIIQIDFAKKEDFIQLMQNNDVTLKFCLSPTAGVYFIDARKCISRRPVNERDVIKKRSTLNKLISQKIIQKVYNVKSLCMDDIVENGEMVIEKEFETLPYYVYFQPYCPENPQQKVHTPQHPIKIEQLSESLQKKALRLPLKFKDHDKLQIAEWYPSEVSAWETVKLQGTEYSLLPLTNGGEAWIKSEQKTANGFPNVISKEEMEQLIKEKIAKK